MKKKECPSCAMNIDASSSFCPICQYEFPKGKPLVAIVAIILALLMLFSLIF